MQTDRVRSPADTYDIGPVQRGLNLALRNRSIVSAYSVALVLFIVIAAFAPGFATSSHVRFLLLTASFVGIVALGQTFVIIGGGFDLSIPWTLTASASLMTALTAGQDAPLFWVLPLVLGGAAVVGLINGLGVTFLRVSPIIMTLSINVIIQGAVLLKFSGSTATSAPPLVKYLVNGVIGPLPSVCGSGWCLPHSRRWRSRIPRLAAGSTLSAPMPWSANLPVSMSRARESPHM